MQSTDFVRLAIRGIDTSESHRRLTDTQYLPPLEGARRAA
jgi:hypothetical protein